MSSSHATASKSMIQRLANDPMLVLDRMAFQNGAVNLGLGFPDFPPPNHIIQALSEAAIGDNHMLHHYTRPYGHPRLVKVLSKMYSKLLSIPMDPTDNILITIGAFQGLSSICQSLIEPGDEWKNTIFRGAIFEDRKKDQKIMKCQVILLEPFYTPYKDLLEIRGAVPVFVPLHPMFQPMHDQGLCLVGIMLGSRGNTSDCFIVEEQLAAAARTFSDTVLLPLKHSEENKQSSANWAFDKVELGNAVTSKTKAIFLNNPMNPLGKVFAKEELLEISDLCLKHDLLCVADEVYEWLTYGERQHIRIASIPNMWERTVTLGSAGKSFNVTGWKVGWCLGPKHLIQVLQNYHFSAIRTCPSILQEAIAVAFEKEMLLLNKPESYFQTLCKEAEEKRNKLCKYLNSAGFKAIVPDGCYYIIADISNVQDNLMKYAEISDEALDYRFAKLAVTEKKICVMPFSIFYSKHHRHLCEKYVRLCFVKTDETLEKAKEILDRWNNS